VKVTLIAATQMLKLEASSVLPEGSALHRALLADPWQPHADALAEFAGRACYKAWERKRPETATTFGYIGHILDQGHYSVLEHSSASFYVEHVSRALLLELERHRFLSFSVESQRYVNQVTSHPEPVIPPALRGTGHEEIIRREYAIGLAKYEQMVTLLRDEGHGLKQAREAARALLPNATPVDFVVTGNLRCWRDVIHKRYHEAADAEIRGFATAILSQLRGIAPSSFQDIPNEPFKYQEA
jgi:thymidylate synthase (FAD)